MGREVNEVNMDTTIAEPIEVVCADSGMKRMTKVTGAGSCALP